MIKYKIMVLKLLVALVLINYYKKEFNVKPLVEDAEFMLHEMEKYGNEYIET